MQDFDAEVQRPCTASSLPNRCLRWWSLRSLGFDSVNVDLIYGLPRQTPESFDRTLAQVAQLRPDRIALYAYAHLPGAFQATAPHHLCGVAHGREQALHVVALARCLHGCWIRVRGHGPLCAAHRCTGRGQAPGRLHRNFQGYSTQPDCDLIGLGVSAIGRVGQPTARTPRRWMSTTTSWTKGGCP